MYILYNHDGSIKRTKFSEFIQKGNNNVNEIFVSIDGLDTDDYLVYGSFELPNEEVVGPVVCSGPVTREIDGVEYSGYIISIHNGLTQYPGKVHASIVVTENVELNPQTLYTYPVVLTINDSAVAEVTQVTVQQYLQLLQEINKKLSISSNKYIKIINTEHISSYEFDTSIYNVGDLVFNTAQSNLMLYELYEDDDELKARAALLDLWLGDGSSDITLYDEQRQLAIKDDLGNTCLIDPLSGVIYKNGISSEKRRVVTKTSGSGTLSSAEVSMLNEFPSYIIISSGNDRLVYEHSETSASSLYFKQLITQTVVDSADDTKTYGETIITVNKTTRAYSTSIVETVFYPASVIDSKLAAITAIASGKSAVFLLSTTDTGSSYTYSDTYYVDANHELVKFESNQAITDWKTGKTLKNDAFESTTNELSLSYTSSSTDYLIVRKNDGGIAKNIFVLYSQLIYLIKLGDVFLLTNTGYADRYYGGFVQTGATINLKFYEYEVDTSGLVTLATAQDINGSKTFKADQTIGFQKKLYFNQYGQIKCAYLIGGNNTKELIVGINSNDVCYFREYYFSPVNDGTVSLGEPGTGHRWQNLYLSGDVSFGSTSIKQNTSGNLWLYTTNGSVEIGGGLCKIAADAIPNNNDRNLGSPSYKWKDLYLSGNITDGTYSLTVADINAKGKLYLHKLSWNDTGTSIASDAGTVHRVIDLTIVTNSPTPFEVATINTRLPKELIRFPGTITQFDSNTVTQGVGEVVSYIEQWANDTYIILEDGLSSTQAHLYLASTKINESSFSDNVTEL